MTTEKPTKHVTSELTQGARNALSDLHEEGGRLRTNDHRRLRSFRLLVYLDLAFEVHDPGTTFALTAKGRKAFRGTAANPTRG